MGMEIERKFLVDKNKLPHLANGYTIKQGYVQTQDYTTVRIRIRDTQGFLTIKSKNKGASRLEFEYPIPLLDAQEMLTHICQDTLVEKTRYLIPYDGHTWELDIFKGLNEGLIIAEIELNGEDETFTLPNWVTTDVTDDVRYFNSNLLHTPYNTWTK